MDETLVGLLDRNADHAAMFDGRFDDVQDGQSPEAVTVCCSDSRVLQDGMWDNSEPGRLFTCGNIGNRVIQRTNEGRVVSGDVLYPLVHAGTETAVVVGHTGCGAVTATYDALTEGVAEPPGIRHCIDLLAPQLEAGVEALSADLERAAGINRLVEYNVDVYDFQDVYGDRRGEVHVVNVDGDRDVARLRAAHPDVDDRIRRLWTY
ncbi:IcfA [Halobacteriales archaeon QH_7_69_31]|nr:MAG: IcfA [Halobacteriales archaeon QH_7_69_31]